MTLFVDRCHNKNVWYVVENGKFIAGPYTRKYEACKWINDYNTFVTMMKTFPEKYNDESIKEFLAERESIDGNV